MILLRNHNLLKLNKSYPICATVWPKHTLSLHLNRKIAKSNIFPKKVSISI